MLNRTRLLENLRKHGYTGSEDHAEAKSWYEACPVILTGEDDKAIDFDAVWTKTVYVAADAGEDIQIQEMQPEPEANMAEDPEDEDEELEKAAPAPTRKASRVRRVDSAMSAPAVHGTDSASVGRKKYGIKTGRTGAMLNPKLSDKTTAKFDDAHSAEVFAASARLAIAKAVPLVADYSERHNDMAIITEISRGKGIRQMCGKECESAWHQKAGSISNPTTGGVLAARGYLNDLIYMTETYGVARRLANVVAMNDGVVDRPRKTAIQAMNHQGENGAFGNQNPSYDMVTLTAKKIGGLTLISTELMEDAAINVADDIAASFAEAQLIREDQDFFLGDGTSTYGGHVGLLNAPWLQTEATAAWGSVDHDDFINLVALPENFSQSQGTFVMSRQAFTQTAMRIAQNKGGVTASEFASGEGRGGDADGRLNGWNVVYSQVMPTSSGSSGARWGCFGDIAASGMLGDRRQFSVESSDQRYFDSDQIAIRATARIAVNIHGDGRTGSNGPAAGLVLS